MIATVDSEGKLYIGSQYAGQKFRVEEEEDGVLYLTLVHTYKVEWYNPFSGSAFETSVIAENEGVAVYMGLKWLDKVRGPVQNQQKQWRVRITELSLPTFR